MSVAYDPQIIRSFAQKLYTRAERMVAFSTLLWTFMGFVGGIGFGILAKMEGGSSILGLVGAAFGAAFGYAWAQGRAFALKLAAQQALCQVAIEQNTRVQVAAPVMNQVA